MTAIEAAALPAVEPAGLRTYANPNDVRRDLHAFVAYVEGRTIKRTTQENGLPGGDWKRLEQLIPDRGRVGDWLTLGGRQLQHYALDAYDWIGYLDSLARSMGFVEYAVPDSRYYFRMSPSRDNVMQYQDAAYRAFLALPPAEQDRRLLDTLVRVTPNELFAGSPRGGLDQFMNWPAHSVAPDLTGARRLLLDILAGCEPGVWHATADLVAYLKEQHPSFLIPQVVPVDKRDQKHLKVVRKRNEPPPAKLRYAGYIENPRQYPYAPVPEDAVDGFERVEGRFVERFLEGIPLTLGYVEVAYADAPLVEGKPLRGVLRAFRVTERFQHAIHGAVPQPRVIVQPNFEVFVESTFYPAAAIHTLAHLGDLVSEHTATIIRLRKQKAAAYLSQHPEVDLVATLTGLTGQDLPQNVAVELREWASHADAFTLYDGFGLVESLDYHAEVGAQPGEAIGPTLRLVRDPRGLSSRLLAGGTVALHLAHGDGAWTPVPPAAHSLFPQAAVAAPRKEPRPAAIQRSTLIRLQFGDADLLDAFRKGLLDARCVAEVDRERLTLILAQQDEGQVHAVIDSLRGDYAITLEDLS